MRDVSGSESSCVEGLSGGESQVDRRKELIVFGLVRRLGGVRDRLLLSVLEPVCNPVSAVRTSSKEAD